MSHAPRSWYAIRAAASDSAPVEVSIHDEIGAWGISAKQFLGELASIPAARAISLSLHSPGGEVFDGLAIYNALKSRGNVDVTIAGLAASMASVIAMAGRTVTMPRNAYLMIHNPSGVAIGDSADMRELADLLDKLKGSLVSAYTERTGIDPEEIEEMMDAETWLTGEEAAAKGFVDSVSDTLALAASASFGSRFAHAPRALFDTPPPVMETQNPETPVAATEDSTETTVEVTTTESTTGTTTTVETSTETPDLAEETADPEASMNDAALAVAAAGVLKKARATRAQVEALTAERDAALAKISELEAANTTLRSSVELVAQLRAEIAKLEADDKTLAARAAEIAASHGLRPDALGALPAPVGEAPSLLDQFNALNGAEKRAFYLKNEEQLKREIYKK
jgi:ATP-dependent Clp endopeptidase proteolytic subunit ClpP